MVADGVVDADEGDDEADVECWLQQKKDEKIQD